MYNAFKKFAFYTTICLVLIVLPYMAYSRKTTEITVIILYLTCKVTIFNYNFQPGQNLAADNVRPIAH